MVGMQRHLSPSHTPLRIHLYYKAIYWLWWSTVLYCRSSCVVKHKIYRVGQLPLRARKLTTFCRHVLLLINDALFETVAIPTYSGSSSNSKNDIDICRRRASKTSAEVHSYSQCDPVQEIRTGDKQRHSQADYPLPLLRDYAYCQLITSKRLLVAFYRLLRALASLADVVILVSLFIAKRSLPTYIQKNYRCCCWKDLNEIVIVVIIIHKTNKDLSFVFCLFFFHDCIMVSPHVTFSFGAIWGAVKVGDRRWVHRCWPRGRAGQLPATGNVSTAIKERRDPSKNRFDVLISSNTVV